MVVFLKEVTMTLNYSVRLECTVHTGVTVESTIVTRSKSQVFR
jgi:hypothetical protein